MRVSTFLFASLLFSSLLLAGCPESRTPGSDAGPSDAPAAPDAPRTDSSVLPDVPPLADAPNPADVIVEGDTSALAGRTLFLRVWDNSVGVGTPWRAIAADPATGRFSERFVDGMPSDVFGVFVDAFLDDGDGQCTSDPAFRGFVSNEFGPDVTFTFTADPDTGVACTDLPALP